MVEKITKEERMVSLAIEKAKEVIQAFQDGTTVEMEGDLQGEEIKLKSPKKNPAEETVDNPIGSEEGYGYVKVRKAETIVKEILTELNQSSVFKGKWFNVLKILSKEWDSKRDYKEVGGVEDDEYNPVLEEDARKLRDEKVANLEAEIVNLEGELRDLNASNEGGKNDAKALAVNTQITALESQINEIGKAIIILTKLFK